MFVFRGMARLFITALTERFCFAPYARLTFSIALKVSKRSSPHLGFSLRENSPRYVVAPGAGLRAIHGPIPLRGSRPLRPLTQRLRSAWRSRGG